MVEFYKALLDFNFSSFVTMRVIKPLYIIWLVFIGLGVLFSLLFSVMGGPMAIIMWLIFTPIWVTFNLVMTRVWMEALVLIFDINDRVEAMAAGQQRPQLSPGALPPL